MRTTASAAVAAAITGLVPSVLRADIFTNVPAAELSGYQIIYELDIPNSASFNATTAPNYNTAPGYITPPSSIAPGSFGRIAYYLELDTGSGPQWVYASMDRFTAFADRTGVPRLGTSSAQQRIVDNVNVFSNVAGINTGTGLSGYNIEFFPNNYGQANTRNIPNASSSTANASGYDWGDGRPSSNTFGTYGSMQIHNHANSQVLFAYNKWAGSAGNSDLGIGNNTVIPSGQTAVPLDWTFRGNAADYSFKRLQVLVGGAAPAAPALGIGAPAHVYSNAPETQNMVHLYTLPVPQTGNGWNGGGVPYTVDNTPLVQPGSFDRVGYYLELQPTGGGPLQYAYVSMDAFTTDPTKVGIPASDASATFQRNVSNMNVVSNVGTITTGTNIQTGNIEFWPNNFSGANGRAAVDGGPVPNAGAGFDFGDTITTPANGHGSFQIHNYDLDGAGSGTAGQTIMAINDWGGTNAGGNIEIGIGNNTAGNADWTLVDTGQNFTIRNLYVFVQPVPEPGSIALLGGAVAAMMLRRRRSSAAPI